MITTDPKVNRDIAALKSDVHRVREDLADTVRSVACYGGNMIMRNRNRLRETIAELEGRAKERLRDTSDVLKDRGHGAIAGWRTGVEHRPITSVAIAFAAGLLLASLIERKWQ
jgi:ElaB/YqjD/DUF883 family membrane-anchored ribosome-binding protein